MGNCDTKVGTRRARAIPLAAIGGVLFPGAVLVRDWRKPKCGAVIYAPPQSASCRGGWTFGQLAPKNDADLVSRCSVARAALRIGHSHAGGLAFPGVL